MFYYIIIAISIIIYILFLALIYLYKLKIEKLEKKIIYLFKERNNQIPSIYEVTRNYLNKHNEIFKHSIILKKRDFLEDSFYSELIEKTNTYKKIHNELNFIFKVCNKNQKLDKNWKFLYIKDIIVDKSNELWKNIEVYKKVIQFYNNLIILKNISIIWLLFPIYKKRSI